MKYFVTVLFLAGILWAQPPNLKLLQSNLISGLIPDVEDGYGIVFRDLNNDSYPDVYVVCFRNMNRLLVNNGGIIPFIDRTMRSGLGGDLSSRGRTNLELGASCADYDNDGRPDIFLAGWGKTTKLFRNLGNFRFEDVSATLHLQGLPDANQGVWFDANSDGYLDLYITDEHHSNRLLLSDSRGGFKEHSWAYNFADTSTSQGAVHADFDNDGDQDLYVCNWHGPDYLLLNDGKGIFYRARLNLPTLVSSISTNSAVAGDVDNDGRSDLLVAGHNGRVYLYYNKSLGDSLRFETHTNPGFDSIANPVYGLLLTDFNQDGWQDLFVAVRDAANRLYLGDGNGGFEAQYDADGQSAYSTGSATADVDNDGDLDLFVSNKNRLGQVYLNPLNQNKVIRVKLVGVRSNREAIGARVYFYSGRDSLRRLIASHTICVQAGYLSSQGTTIYQATAAFPELDAEVIFPSGKSLKRRHLMPGKSYTIYEYGTLMRSVLKSWTWVRQNSYRPESWLNLGLFLLLVLIMVLYVRLGLARYHWQGAEVASQLLIWFIVAVVTFMAVKGQRALTVLVTLNGISLLALCIALVYSEQQLRQRRRRLIFRQKAQNLSDRMIRLHDNPALYRSVAELLRSHDAVTNVYFLTASETEPGVYVDPDNDTKVSVDKDLRDLIITQPVWIRPDWKPLAGICARLNSNVLMPVRRGEELFALIALFMQTPGRALNREDLQLMVPLTNQIAIALENNRFIEESARMVQELTEARTREQYTAALEETNRQLDSKNQELNRLFDELKQKEGQLIHSEKMASLGHLVAGISHELNNPISFIYANTRALENYLSELQTLWTGLKLSKQKSSEFKSIVDDLRGIVEDNLRGSQTVKDLVLDLKNFSRLDHAEWKESRLAEGIENSLKMLRPQMKDGIKVDLDLRENPRIFCSPGQLNQVFLNLFANAVQAMQGRGKLTVEMHQNAKELCILVTDTGPGIPDAIRNKIFDPFFTTKEVNQGTGLGLSISYSIIQAHKGRLEVKNVPDGGARFSICLPLKADRKQEVQANEIG